MLNVKKQYITDEDNNRIAVQLDIDTYAKIEEIIEDYGLGKYLEEAENEPRMSREEAMKFIDK